MATTTYFEGLILDYALNQQPYVIEDWYVGLWTSNPTEEGLLPGEVSAADYQRKPVEWSATFANTLRIDWAAALSAWGDVSYLALMNGPTKGTGNMLNYQLLSQLYAVEIGRPLFIPAGGLQLSVI